MEKVSDDEHQDKALSYTECDDPLKYKKKNKGFVLPFNTRTKDNATEVTRLNKNYKYKKPKNIDQIKK